MIFRWLALALLISAGSACAGAPTLVQVALPTNDLVYDPVSDRIFTSVPSRAGAQRGNTITPIDPYTGALGTSVFVASEPTKLALADDGSRVYVASAATNAVTPFSLLTMTPGAPFFVGDVGHRVEDMDVAPGNPAAIAVSLVRSGSTPRGVGLSVFVDGNKLPKATQAINYAIEFGATSNILYGHNSESSSKNFNSYVVDLSPTGGITPGFNVTGMLTQLYLDMEFDDGRMYFTNGQVIDVSTPAPVGAFVPAIGPVEPDSAAGRTYVVVEDQLKAFDQATFVPLGEMMIPEFGATKQIVSLGSSALALTTTSDMVFIIRLDGDFDANGIVDASDYDLWKADFGSATKRAGDANRDNVVDAADYVLWRANLGQTLVGNPASGTSNALAVPEPAGWSLGLIGFAAVCRNLTRRRLFRIAT